MTLRSSSLLMLAAVAALGTAACSKRVAEPVRGIAANNAELPAPAKAAAAMAAEEAKANDPALHGMRKKAGIEVPVFVDGKPAGILRYGDLPRGLELRSEPGRPDGRKYLYSLRDYLTAIGVNVAAIQSMHIRDMRLRVASIQGDEIRRDKRFMFAFMEGTTGIAHTHWSTQGLKDELHLDEIGMISIFVKSPATELDAARHCYAKEGGCLESLPAGFEAPKGTRVYLDGRFLGYVKRRAMGDAMIVGRRADGTFKYSLAKFAEGVGIKDAEIAGVELVSGDDVVARLDQKSWQARRDQYSFELGKHQHGKAKILLGADVQVQAADITEPLKDETVELTSLQFYRSAKGATRKLTPIADLDQDTTSPTQD